MGEKNQSVDQLTKTILHSITELMCVTVCFHLLELQDTLNTLFNKHVLVTDAMHCVSCVVEVTA